LHTLPLALGSIILGNALAYHDDYFHWEIFLLAVLTAVFLQVLSNVANDFGDSLHGADSAERSGPARAVQSGDISPKAMKNAIIVFSILSLVSGLLLLYFSANVIGWAAIAVMLGVGVIAIIAAITYTASSRPYGYRGLGDISVLLFFGLVGVGGAYFLQAGNIRLLIILPALAYGLLSAGVLNVNNIRDIESDEKAGKRSIPVIMGRRKAKIYHYFLLAFAAILTLLFAISVYNTLWQYLFLLVLIPFLFHSLQLKKANTPEEINPLLKQLAIFSFLYAVAMSVSVVV
jgi:1,4-dihydroxy-2-naphthoate polyprenyltransferase